MDCSLIHLLLKEPFLKEITIFLVLTNQQLAELKRGLHHSHFKMQSNLTTTVRGHYLCQIAWERSQILISAVNLQVARWGHAREKQNQWEQEGMR